jgi:hypothetical protein
MDRSSREMKKKMPKKNFTCELISDLGKQEREQEEEGESYMG